jgi:AcrR family transcriptional regulator
MPEQAMARTIKPEEHQEKRKQILDTAQRLIYTKGYEQLTIQDLLDELRISKGAFYHYFDSRQALLEAVVERYGVEAEALFNAIVRESQLPALVRLQQFFDAAGRWKTARKEFLLALLRVWYTDDNAIVRVHVEATMGRRIEPLLAEVIREGVGEGVLSTPYPDQAGGVALALLVAMGKTFSALLLSDLPRPEAQARAARLTGAYNDALERVLGAPPGSLHLIDAATLGEWFTTTGDPVAAAAATEV